MSEFTKAREIKKKKVGIRRDNISRGFIQTNS